MMNLPPHAPSTRLHTPPHPPAFHRSLPQGEEVPFTTLEMVKLLGRGASSIVQQKRDPSTGKNYAMKIINMFDKGKRDQVMREIHSLYDASCDALVDFYGCTFGDGKISVALEYV